jgi:hypothetical protein
VILNKAGCLKGVFRTAEPSYHAVDGTPCYILLRFYEDGLVLHASLCRDVEAKWDQIAQWFNRDAAATEEKGWNTGVGPYTIKGSQVEFSTVMYDRETRLQVDLEHSGVVEGDCLRLGNNLVDDPRVYEYVFVPLRAAQT